MSSAIVQEPLPKKGKQIVYKYVLKDIEARAQLGRSKYKKYLRTFNGRNSLWDAYQEALDLAMYLRQRILEETAQMPKRVKKETKK